MRLPRVLRIRIGFVAAWLSVGLLVFLGWAWWRSYYVPERITLARHARLVIISDSGCVSVGFVFSPIVLPAWWPLDSGDHFRLMREPFDSRWFGTYRLWFGWIRQGWYLGPPYWSQTVDGFATPYWLAMLLVSLVPAGVVVKRLGDRMARKAAPPGRVCLRCGYDLSVTPVDSPCPECGLAAHRSVIDHIDPADCRPGWVTWIAVGSLLLLVSYVMFAAYFVYALSYMRTYQIWDVSAFTPTIVAWLMLKVTVLHGVACVMLSRDDRPRAFTWPGFLLRWSLQVLPVFPVAAAGISVWVHTVVLRRTESLQNVSFFLSMALLICPTLTFVRLRQLALRLGRRRLAEHIGIVAAGAGVSLFMLVVGSTFVANYIRRADALFYSFVVMPVALVALFNLWAVLMLFVITPTFFKSAREAALRWRQADAARVMV